MNGMIQRGINIAVVALLLSCGSAFGALKWNYYTTNAAPTLPSAAGISQATLDATNAALVALANSAVGVLRDRVTGSDLVLDFTTLPDQIPYRPSGWAILHASAAWNTNHVAITNGEFYVHKPAGSNFAANIYLATTNDKPIFGAEAVVRSWRYPGQTTAADYGQWTVIGVNNASMVAGPLLSIPANLAHINFRASGIWIDFYTNGAAGGSWPDNGRLYYEHPTNFKYWTNEVSRCGYQVVSPNTWRIYRDGFSVLWTCDGLTNLYQKARHIYFQANSGGYGSNFAIDQSWKQLKVSSTPPPALPGISATYSAAGDLQSQSFNGSGAGLTDIPRTGVTGLETSLDWLTNNAGSGISLGDATNAAVGVVTERTNGLATVAALEAATSPMLTNNHASPVNFPAGVTTVGATNTTLYLVANMYHGASATWISSGPTEILTNAVGGFLIDGVTLNNGEITAVGSGLTGIPQSAVTDLADDLASKVSTNGVDTLNIGTANITNVIYATKSITYTNYTLSVNDSIIFATGTNQIITLPNATNVGRMYTIVCASTTGSLIVTNETGTQTILGALSIPVGPTNRLTTIADGEKHL